MHLFLSQFVTLIDRNTYAPLRLATMYTYLTSNHLIRRRVAEAAVAQLEFLAAWFQEAGHRVATVAGICGQRTRNFKNAARVRSATIAKPASAGCSCATHASGLADILRTRDSPEAMAAAAAAAADDDCTLAVCNHSQ